MQYTGSTAMSHLLHLTFRFKDSVLMKSKLRLINTKKTDNVKLVTKIYQAPLNKADLANLQQKQLLDIIIGLSNRHDAVLISVKDATFLQTQITCLQKE